MTTSKMILALTATVLTAAAMSSATPASANGVRLSFGGPMGSFVASPTRGGGGNSYASHGATRSHKKAPVHTARVHREAPKAQPKIHMARHEPAPQPKARYVRPEPKVVRHYEEPKRRVTVAAVERDRPVKRAVPYARKLVAHDDVKPETVENASPVTSSGAQALVQVQTQADATPAVGVAETPVAAPEPASNVTATVAATEATPETKSDASVSVSASETANAPASAATETAEASVLNEGDVGCKRFIPAVGVTVTVDCEK